MKSRRLIPQKLHAWRPDARLLTRGLSALGLAAVAWSAAQLLATLLSWRADEPALALTAPVAEDGSATRRALARWFVVNTERPATAPLAGLQLIAVIAGKHGVALIGGIEPTPVAVQVGSNARPDLKLVDVRPDRAVFDQNGAKVELAFPTPDAATPLFGPADAASVAPPPPPPPPPPPAATTSASVSRGRLTAIAQGGNLGDWDKGLSAFPSGGLQITSAAEQPLARVLELHDGDIIRQVNNRDLNQLADVSLIYHHFSQAQEVKMEILRDGKPMQITFKITP